MTKSVIEGEQSIMGTIFCIFKVNTVEKVLRHVRDLFQLNRCFNLRHLTTYSGCFDTLTKLSCFIFFLVNQINIYLFSSILILHRKNFHHEEMIIDSAM